MLPLILAVSQVACHLFSYTQAHACNVLKAQWYIIFIRSAMSHFFHNSLTILIPMMLIGISAADSDIIHVEVANAASIEKLI